MSPIKTIMLEYYIYLAGCVLLVIVSYLAFSIVVEGFRSLHQKMAAAARAERIKAREKAEEKFRKAG